MLFVYSTDNERYHNDFCNHIQLKDAKSNTSIFDNVLFAALWLAAEL